MCVDACLPSCQPTSSYRDTIIYLWLGLRRRPSPLSLRLTYPLRLPPQPPIFPPRPQNPYSSHSLSHMGHLSAPAPACTALTQHYRLSFRREEKWVSAADTLTSPRPPRPLGLPRESATAWLDFRMLRTSGGRMPNCTVGCLFRHSKG